MILTTEGAHVSEPPMARQGRISVPSEASRDWLHYAAFAVTPPGNRLNVVRAGNRRLGEGLRQWSAGAERHRFAGCAG